MTTNISKSIDEIITKHLGRPDEFGNIIILVKDDMKTQLLALFRTEMEKIIGEDETVEVNDWDCSCGQRLHAVIDHHRENQLRHTQLQQLDKVLGKDNG